ncbi:MAG: hypothetical protein CMF46_05150 [Legionellales bacterium]|nr:hypothetical protein [Legionellales bacterium]|tara:strand:+ start:3069 stop:3683 length:615 start_codon:yes stop_codon:yes gene_type:complete
MFDSKSIPKKRVYFNLCEIIFTQLFGIGYYKSILDKSQEFFKKHTVCRKFVLANLMIIMWIINCGFWYEIVDPMLQSSDFVFNNLPSSLFVIKYFSIFSIYFFIFRLTVGSVLTAHIWYGEQNLVAQDERDICVRDFYQKESYFYSVIFIQMLFIWLHNGSYFLTVDALREFPFFLVIVVNMLPMILATWNAESIDGSYLNRHM